MKYQDLIQFEPITSVIKLVTTDARSVQEGLVKSYVFSRKMLEVMPQLIGKNLDTNPVLGTEQKGLQIVGSYGTGKSHMMAIVGAIAEDATLLDLIHEEPIVESFKSFAGQYKVLRFEVGVNQPLKDVLFGKLVQYLKSLGIEYRFDDKSIQSYREQLQDMMAAFESAFPDKHLLVIVDEMLEYLKGRNAQLLSNDLSILRQVGELCDGSRFKIMFGVQELLYRSPELQFAAQMLGHASDRYDDVIITKEDVAHIVKQRLLKKTDVQKQQIREHLTKFGHLFDGINTGLNEYVDLFPIHPKYISTFELVRIGKSQREILKTLSAKFKEIASLGVPPNAPGLITYDSYWDDIAQDASLVGIADVRTVKDKMDIINDRIDNHFVQGRFNRKVLAKKIANALAVKVLCEELDKHNGAGARDLKEDLCETLSAIDDPELLIQTMESTANQLRTATAGQYVDQDALSSQFYLRTEGGINIPQIVRDYADTVLKRNTDQCDIYFFQFLQYVLAIQQNPYRTGFQIWQHSLEWLDKKSFRPGYIFFGNPNERSTTEPIQQYYLFFCPLFSALDRNDDEDEVYFDFSALSDSFKEQIYLLGAAKAKHSDASSDQKPLFDSQMKEYQKKALEYFEREYVEKTFVLYKGTKTALKSYQLPGEGASKEMIFSTVAAKVLNKHFTEKFPDYPAFTDLTYSLTPDNFDKAIKSALRKLSSFSAPNREGEAILSGLRLLGQQSIDTSNSPFAEAIRRKLKTKGAGKVLNRDEILYAHYQPLNYWYSVDFNLDYQLEFIVLAAMVFKGDIEIKWQDKTLNATTIEALLQNVPNEDMFTFQTVREPVGIPIKALKALFSNLGLSDKTADLDKQDTLVEIRSAAETLVKKVVTLKSTVQMGLKCRSIELLSPDRTNEYSAKLGRLAQVLDEILSYNTFGKLRAFKLTVEELDESFKALAICDNIDKLLAHTSKFENLIGYLTQAQSYVVESQTPLYNDMEQAIQKLGSVLQAGDEAEFKRYETQLNGLIDQYADYYLQQYNKCRLSYADNTKKEALIASEKKRICDIIQDVELLSKVEYQNWINSVNALKPAKPNMSKAEIKREPYHDFSPREYYNKPSFTISDLSSQLDGIVGKWTTAMRSTFKDPSVKANVDMLDPSDRDLIEAFRSGAEEITLNNAVKLRKLIGELSKGFERIEVKPHDFRKVLAKPMTVEEAKAAFGEYLDDLSKGKDRSKVRIIFTEEK